MKKTFLMLSGMCLCTVAIAQTELGLKASIGTSNLAIIGEPVNNDFVTFDPALAYQLGGYGTVALKDKLLARTEILFNSKGAEEQRLHYVSLPLLLQYKLLEYLRLEAGPELSYLLYAKNPAIGFKSFDVGMDLGANLAISPKLMLGLRYCIGIIEMLEVDMQIPNDQGTPAGTIQLQNRALQLSMNYRLTR